MPFKYKQDRPLEGPKSFVFYVVARVGPNGEYYPLAVASRDDPGARGFAGLDVVNACLGLRKLIACKDNRAAIAAEVRLAKAFYSVPRTTHRVYASNVAVPGTISETERAPRPFPISDSGPIAFPVTSTCLLVGLGFDLESKTAQDFAELKPLGFTLGPTLDNRGMVIVDVTQPHSVRQGILAYDFVKQPYNQDDPFFGLTLGDSDDSEAEPDFDDETIYDYLTGPQPVEDWSQTPLDPQSYIAKFGYDWPYGAAEKVAMAQAVWKPIDAAALHSIWPTSNPSSTGSPPRATSPVGDQGLASLIQKTQLVDEFSDTDINVPPVPDFAKALQSQLSLVPGDLGISTAAGQLLAIAYTDTFHLHWDCFRHTSYKAIAFALQQPGLACVQTVAVCVDHFAVDHLPLFLQALLRLEDLRQVFVLQDPARTDDVAGTRLFLEMTRNAQYQSLLQNTRLILSSAFSAGLRRCPWLPTVEAEYRIPLEAFPVQQMLVRRQISHAYKYPETLGRELDDPPRFWSNYLYFGDSLLTAERFATGFLSFLATRCHDHRLVSFARAPSLLKYMQEQAISPLLAETPSIPLLPISTEYDTDKARRECWAKPRSLVAGSWTVLVSCEGPIREQQNTPFIGYAFVRRRLDTGSLKDAGPHDLQVCNLRGFLTATAPRVDPQLVERRLREANSAIDSKIRQGMRADYDIKPEQWLFELSEEQARNMLRDVMEDAASIRANLPKTINDLKSSGKEPVWYPELSGPEYTAEVQNAERNYDIFRPLHGFRGGGNALLWGRRPVNHVHT